MFIRTGPAAFSLQSRYSGSGNHSRHDHEKVLPLPLLASGMSSGCFKVSRG